MIENTTYRKLKTIRELFDGSIDFDKEIAIDIVKAVFLRDWDDGKAKTEHSKKVSDFVDQFICFAFGLSKQELYMDRRNRKYSYPRMIAIGMKYIFTTIPATEIAASYHRKDHTTVMYSKKRILDMVEAKWQPEEPTIKLLYTQLKESANRAGLKITPEWYNPASETEELIKVLKMGPFHRKKCAPLWLRELMKKKKGQKNVVRQA